MNSITPEVISIIEAANKKEAHLEKVERIIEAGTSDGVARSYGVEVVDITGSTPEERFDRLLHLEMHDRLVADLEADLAAALFAVPRESDGPLSNRDFNSPARTLWRKATSGVRQAARIEATICAARLEAARHAGSMTHNNMGDLDVYAAFWLLIDLVGQGGSMGLGNGSSAREGVFGRLGKGRRQASDGACWCAAAEAAFGRLTAPATGLTITHDKTCGVVVQLDGWGMTVDRDDPTHDRFWAMAPTSPELFPLAGLALLHATAPDSCPMHANAWVKFDLDIEQAAQWFDDVQAECLRHAAEVNAEPKPKPEPAPTTEEDYW